MCRWAAYLGQDIFLEDIIATPGHSLIAQSLDATECLTTTNGDGFGVAWYGDRQTPGLFRDVLPAWSDPNLRALAHQVKSHLFLAHVRASTGTATSRDNCHPFVADNWSFMHNGQIGGFNNFRRAADMGIPETLYTRRKGATDSEVLFLYALKHGLKQSPRQALERAVAELQDMSQTHGTTPHVRLSAALSDGKRLFAVRYASDAHAPSVYYRWSSSRQGWAVVSEPLEEGEKDWTELAPGSFLEISQDGVRTEQFQP